MFSSICFANFFHEFFSVSGVENEITPNIQNKYLVHVIAQPNFQIPNPQYLQPNFVTQKNVFRKKINKKVNKPNIRNLENWLLDDVSEIKRNGIRHW